MAILEANILILGTAVAVLVAAAWYADRVRYAFLLVIREDRVSVQRGKATAAFMEEVRHICCEHNIRRGWLGGVRQAQRIRLVFCRSLPPRCQQQIRNVWGLIGWGDARLPKPPCGDQPKVR